MLLLQFLSFVTVLQEVVGHKMCTFCFHKAQKICPHVPSEKSPQKLPQKKSPPSYLSKISPQVISKKNLPQVISEKNLSPSYIPKNLPQNTSEKPVAKLPLKIFALLEEFDPIFPYQPTR